VLGTAVCDMIYVLPTTVRHTATDGGMPNDRERVSLIAGIDFVQSEKQGSINRFEFIGPKCVTF
jgi:hypothetical protein